MMRAGRTARWGCAAVVTVLVIIGVIGWMVTMVASEAFNSGRELQTVPRETPPLPGEPVPEIDIYAPGRTSDQLVSWAAPLSEATAIPAPALRAYGNAERIAAQAWPGCNLRWTTLAGIGRVETRHGTYSGHFFESPGIDADGVVRPPIVGVPLDGSDGLADIPDSDGGALDGDVEHDRAVGPMQFIPTSWQRFGLDASGDGVADPHHIDDAALSAAKLLCLGRDLSDPGEWEAAILGYNGSKDYLNKVRAAANAYGIGQPAR